MWAVMPGWGLLPDWKIYNSVLFHWRPSSSVSLTAFGCRQTHFSVLQPSLPFFYLTGDISCTSLPSLTDRCTCLGPLYRWHWHQLLMWSSKCLRDIPLSDRAAMNRVSGSAGGCREWQLCHLENDCWEASAVYWYELCCSKLMHQYNNILMSAVAQPFNISTERCICRSAVTVMMIVIIIWSCAAITL